MGNDGLNIFYEDLSRMVRSVQAWEFLKKLEKHPLQDSGDYSVLVPTHAGFKEPFTVYTDSVEEGAKVTNACLASIDHDSRLDKLTEWLDKHPELFPALVQDDNGFILFFPQFEEVYYHIFGKGEVYEYLHP